jgi:hypothetical protein
MSEHSLDEADLFQPAEDFPEFAGDYEYAYDDDDEEEKEEMDTGAYGDEEDGGIMEQVDQAVKAGTAARGVCFNPEITYYEPPPNWDDLMYLDDESLHSDLGTPPSDDDDDDDDSDTPEFGEEPYFDPKSFDGNMSLGHSG